MKARIMIVEDEGIIAMEIEERLKKLGYDVAAVVSTGKEAIKKAEKISLDMVIMDIVLRGDMNGIEAAEQIQRSFEIPTVYLTAHADEDTLQQAKKTESYGYLLKPFSEDAMRATLEMALYKHKLIKTLKKSEEQLANAQKLAHLGSYEFEVPRGEIHWSDETFRITGRDPALGEPTIEEYYRIVHPDDVAHTQHIVDKCISEKQPFDMEYRIIIGDGLIKHIQSVGEPVVNKAGNVVKIFGIILDITDRKKAEEEILVERNKLQSVIGAIQQGLTIQDLDYNITYQNDLLLKLFGNRLGEKCYAVYEGKDHVCEGCPVEMSFKDGQQHTALRKVTMPSGKTAYWENTANPIRDASRKIISCLEIAHEVTERVQAEEEKEKLHQQIMQSEKMAAIGEIGAGIAHELNTPLNVILGYQELMKKKIAKCPEFKEYLDISIEEVEQCRQLIGDFLLYARPSADSGMLKKHSVDITAVIKSIIKLSSIHKEKNIKIKLDIEDNFPLVSGNQEQITQVFMNVLNNAIQAMPKGGDITISARHIKNGGIAKNGEIIEFRITDTGEGIPKENITKVFDPFFTSKRPGKGTGLGLAVCQRIMENHKGTIRIESDPGRGTAVIGQLPV